LFPNATQIADRYHVKERLSTIAKAIHGPSDPQAKPWAKLRHDELDLENIDAIIQALTEHKVQRTLRGLLGTPLRSPEGCMTAAAFFIFLSCALSAV
jgi:hypothetical protein